MITPQDMGMRSPYLIYAGIAVIRFLVRFEEIDFHCALKDNLSLPIIDLKYSANPIMKYSRIGLV